MTHTLYPMNSGNNYLTIHMLLKLGVRKNKVGFNNLPNSLNATNTPQQQNVQNDQQFIPHIQPHATTSTVTTATLTITIQQDYNRQSFRVPQYYTNSLSYPDSSRRRRRRSNTHTQNKERKHKKKDGNN